MCCSLSSNPKKQNNTKTRKKYSMSMETSSGWFRVKHLPFIGDLMMDFLLQGVVGGVTGIITKPVEGR